jgi:hypothetical protein
VRVGFAPGPWASAVFGFYPGVVAEVDLGADGVDGARCPGVTVQDGVSGQLGGTENEVVGEEAVTR